MATFITRLDEPGDGPRLAVKDILDVAGAPTTAGCRALATIAAPADADAACLVPARAQGARIVGKTNLHELAFGASGINPWFGTPRNPLDPARIPGGSSSGSAVAVATGEADVGLGSDTGGSIRIPSACCGTVGLKTTYGRIPRRGVWPLAQSLDTIGPMAADVGGVVLGMQLLEPGFRPAAPPSTVGRFRGVPVAPEVDAAVDRALAVAELEVVEIDLPRFGAATAAAATVLLGEAWLNDRLLYERDPGGIGDSVRVLLENGAAVEPVQLAEARAAAGWWRDEVDHVLERVQVIVTPTLPVLAPVTGQEDRRQLTSLTRAFNLSGHPALALPVPVDGPIPASLQIVGRHGGEELLVAAAAVIERAVEG